MRKIKEKDIQFRCNKHPAIVYEQDGHCPICQDRGHDATQVFYCSKCKHWANVPHSQLLTKSS
jgi:hypothetical protein